MISNNQNSKNLKGGTIIAENKDGIWVRLDSKTVIIVKPGSDIQEHINKFINRRGSASYLPWD